MSGPFGSSQWMYASGGFYPYEIDQSVRFNDNDSAYLQKTFSTSGNAKTFTISFWFKRCRDDTAEYLFAGGTTVNDRFHMDINASGTFQIEGKASGATVVKMEGGPRLRDLGAWYHFVLRVDTTQATASDRVRLYVNGELLTFNSNTYPPQNENLHWNINDQVRIGRAGWATSYFDGYFAEFINVDGSSLAPTSFGETKAGIWIPKDYTGSYGTNGFKLAFQDSASLGDDTSGNGNDFTSSGLASTDQMLDTPTNNFATMNALDKGSGMTLSEGNLKIAVNSSNTDLTRSTGGMSSGKWYAESRYVSGTNWHCGIATSEANLDSFLGSDAYGYSYYNSGQTYNNGSPSSYGASYTTGDVVGISFDADAGTLEFYKNGVSQGTAFTGLTSGPYFFSTGVIDGTGVWNFGQDSTFAGATTAGGNAGGNGIGDFKYSVPSGYLALCTANLPAPGIDPAADEAPEDYFNTVLWTGDGASSRSISGYGFAPDFIWAKQRSQAIGHALYDSVRGAGANSELSSDSTAAEGGGNNDQYGYLSSFDSDGFTAVDGTSSPNYYFNENTQTFVGWGWKAGGTAVSNTDGSVTSSVSASPDSGFSIVTYTGPGSGGGTIGHGLGKAPSMIIVKNRSSAENWRVYHSSLTATKYLNLNATGAAVTSSAVWAGTEPTASVFSVANDAAVSGSGNSLVAYCFADIEGIVKAGSHVGNGSTDGPFLYTGFRPAFVMFKRTDSTSNWAMFDATREPTNVNDSALYANASDAEIANNSTIELDFVSNGIKLRDAPNQFNVSSATYVWLAFAEQPFKYANAR